MPRTFEIDQDAFNLSIRKFLKTIGVNSQREIEQAVRDALDLGSIAGSGPLVANVTLEIPALGLKIAFDGEIKLR